MNKTAVIAGGGPAGLTCGIYLARAGWEVTIFDDEEHSTSALSEAPLVENYPGFPGGIPGAALLELMKDQALENNILTRGEGIASVDSDRRTAIDTNGGNWRFDAFIMATGTVPRKLQFKTVPENAEIPIHTCALCDGGLYGKNDAVMVIGAGDTAFADGLYLSDLVGHVYLVARGDIFRATNLKTVEKFKEAPNTEIIVNSVITTIRDLGDRTYDVELNNGERHILANGFFSCIGHSLKHVPISGEHKDRIWECGDCKGEDDRQAILAAASGARTALDIIRHMQ